MAIINGTENNDVLNGTNQDDTITGNGLDDTINAGDGDDTVYGDYGPSGAGNGAQDADPLQLQFANAQNESVDGTSVEYLNATTLEDGTPVKVKLTLLSKSNPNLTVDLTGGEGFEILLNGVFNASMRGETVEIRMEFFNQNTNEPVTLNTVGTFGDLDRASNGTENVTISKQFVSGFGTSQNSNLVVQDGVNTISASGGRDTNPSDQNAWFSTQIEGQQFIEFTLTARGGQTGYTMNGNLIEDVVIVPTEPGDDTIDGGNGDDVIFGQEGDDTISGGEGNDRVEGGTGNDLIEGGAGQDQLSGGDDRDTFVVSSGADGSGDRIDGGTDGDDFDTLDLTGSGPLRFVNLTTDADGDSQSGTVEFLDANGNVSGRLHFSEIEQIIPCFTTGTLIATPKGEVPVEALCEGDRVITRDNGLQQIRWIGKKSVGAKALQNYAHLRPVLVQAGSLGHGMPERDLLLSPNHRVLLMNEQVDVLFEEREVLSSAKHLCQRDGVDVVEASTGVTYWHILFDNHEVILSNGAWSESFQPGDYSLKGVGQAQRSEIFELFPDLSDTVGQSAYGSARLVLKAHEAKLL
ncbi:Ca2+-binding RTX toxin-like protein [Litoreibacter halocynthiae]|uniref:Ca2+-binding RTX toxin-like protein n=1 Tax=Litoreibacter halocynthiae TaxID=1242689 RepID=A0A4R7LQB4_9RHOB|nr:Hint domain-containing protein [Litoreibacter halocynthiae]TDT77679.1 Ca2+-binding RTX toxin-like protein [Litoreibacter halocynthiae]